MQVSRDAVGLLSFENQIPTNTFPTNTFNRGDGEKRHHGKGRKNIVKKEPMGGTDNVIPKGQAATYPT